VRSAYYVHESAWVDEGAQVGESTKIWHFCHVMSSAVIGARCSLGQNVFVAANVCLGNGVKVQNNVSIYEGVTLEDDVFCGPSMVFTNDLNPRSAFPKGAANYVKTQVKRGCTIGANATVVCGITLGAHALIGAGSVVTRDVPDFAVVYGTPARLHGWICICGEKLLFEGEETDCQACGRWFSKEEEESVVLQGEKQ